MKKCGKWNGNTENAPNVKPPKYRRGRRKSTLLPIHIYFYPYLVSIKTDFSTYNETDVRENFIAPLLKLLGYGKNTVNNVLTEKSLKLKEPFQRIGRKNIRIDYIPTVRLNASPEERANYNLILLC